MKYLPLLLLAPLFAEAVIAQSNTVAGLDGRLTVVDQLTYWGRRGAAHPNGEIGMAMLNEMCNPGSVEIPWQAAMSPDHPKFGFLIARESGGRMVQINDWSYVKHAFISTNSPSTCGGTCNPGTSGGTRMGLRCSDIYGAGNNGDPYYLGPPVEIDPWLGTWQPQGSYFDRGDPDVGPPLNNDGNRSLSQSQVSAFGNVKNRVTVKEADLLVPGARYFYGIHLLHQGEALVNRGDNNASRGFTPVYSGGVWALYNNGVNQVYGSILQHWTGATLSSASNGSDDGRFVTAVKVTALGGGQHHFEYAVHNMDNNRGGASFRIPLPAASTVSNFTFRDIDSNALNEWTAARQGNELVFSAPASNPLNWNTIYNFGFDCNTAPGSGNVTIDEARIGPGALSVSMLSMVPGGVPLAAATNVGNGCGGTPCGANAFYEQFSNGGNFDLDNSGLSMTLSGTNYQVGNGTGFFVQVSGGSQNLNLGDNANTQITLPFPMPYLGGTTNSLWVCSNGFVSVTDNGSSSQPTTAAVLSGAHCWYAAWMDLDPSPNGGGGVFVDYTPSMVRVTWNNVFQYGTTFPCTFQMQFMPTGNVNFLWRIVAAGSPTIVGWSAGNGAIDPGSRDITATRNAGWTVCNTGVPHLALDASARPILGTTFNLVTSHIPPSTPFGAVVLSTQQAIPPIDLTSQGMPGCFGYVQGGVTVLFVIPGASHTLPFQVPNSATLSGMSVVNQSFTYSPPRTPLGVIASNAVLLLVGQM